MAESNVLISGGVLPEMVSWMSTSVPKLCFKMEFMTSEASSQLLDLPRGSYTVVIDQNRPTPPKRLVTAATQYAASFSPRRIGAKTLKGFLVE